MLTIFEGLDGTGKSTQVRLLAEALRERGLTVVTSREPTDGPFGQKLRESMQGDRLSPEEELELFHEDRRHHVETLVRPALERGEVVLLDRYYFSTMAYQGARGFDPEEIREANEGFAPRPDQVFLLELPIDLALERIGLRDGEANSFEKRENLEACARIFDAMSDPFIHRLDASQSPEAIHREVLALTEKKLTPASSSSATGNPS